MISRTLESSVVQQWLLEIEGSLSTDSTRMESPELRFTEVLVQQIVDIT